MLKKLPPETIVEYQRISITDILNLAQQQTDKI